MEKDLEKLSKQELIALLTVEKKQVIQAEKVQERLTKKNQQQQKLLVQKDKIVAQKQETVTFLKNQVAQLKHMLFGQKRERFIKEPLTQLPLPFGQETLSPTEEGAAEEVHQQKLEKVRKKTRRPHPGRKKLPDHLPVEEIEIHPPGDLSQMRCIGKEITEELECVPAKFYIKRYIRYKYVANKEDSTPIIGKLPSRVIDKAIPGAGLLSQLLIDKYVDHLPLYRQRQRFAREGIELSESTINEWVKQSILRLEVLYEYIRKKIRQQGYLQADETPLKVLDKAKKGACHQGYFWVYQAPLEKLVFFEYQSTRGYQATETLLKGFRGYLQSDGYGVYEKVAKQKQVTHLACWAHLRRKFYEARNNDPIRAEKALIWIGKPYQIERELREEGARADRKKEVRLEKALPIINQLGKWIQEEIPKVLPKSSIGQAFAYACNRWTEFSNYLLDGYLEIDNNLTENALRPVALGRKNYLFAGSHDAAQRSAIIYTFMAICKQQQVNPREWLRFVLENILDTSLKNLDTLLPHNFQKINPQNNTPELIKTDQ